MARLSWSGCVVDVVRCAWSVKSRIASGSRLLQPVCPCVLSNHPALIPAPRAVSAPARGALRWPLPVGCRVRFGFFGGALWVVLRVSAAVWVRLEPRALCRGPGGV